MPIYKILQPDEHTTLMLWKITEDFDELISPLKLTNASTERVYQMRSKIHRLGFLSIRHLLRSFGYTDEDLYYDDYGKPHLRDGKFVSISHSFNFSALIISDHKIGVDLEKQREKIKRISTKFIGYESHYLDSGSDLAVKELSIIWCIKESLYKLFAEPGLSFKKNTLVIPFNLNDTHTRSWIDFKERKLPFQSHFFEFEGFTCAYVMP